jgi:hypothetical protein
MVGALERCGSELGLMVLEQNGDVDVDDIVDVDDVDVELRYCILCLPGWHMYQPRSPS